MPKAITREQWEAAAKAWNDWGPFLRKWLGSATEIVLDMVGRGSGRACARRRRGCPEMMTMEVVRRERMGGVWTMVSG